MGRKTKQLSISPELLQAAEKRAASLGLGSFSEYIRQLVRADLQGGKDLTIVSEDGRPYAVNAKIDAGRSRR